jgi:hypothetical protein
MDLQSLLQRGQSLRTPLSRCLRDHVRSLREQDGRADVVHPELESVIAGGTVLLTAPACLAPTGRATAFPRWRAEWSAVPLAPG